MRFILLSVIALGVAGAILFVFMNEQKKVSTEAVQLQETAKEKADAYKKNQADMMKQLGQ